MKAARRWVMLLAVVAAALVACDTESGPLPAEPTPPTQATEPGESAPVVEDVPSVCEVADCGPPADPLDTLEELVDAADLIAVVRAEREIDAVHGIGGLVISRVELRAEMVLQGPLVEGEALVAHLAGGVSAVSGNPWVEGGFKPKPGEPSREQRYAEHPPFQLGKRELVFFHEVEADDGSLGLYPMHEGRYRFVQGTLAPLFGDQHRLFDRLAPRGIREALTGTPLSDLPGLIAPLVAAAEERGPAPLRLRGDARLADVRTRLSTELPYVRKVVEAVEAGDVPAVSRLSAFTPFECATEPGTRVTCADAGVAPGTMIEMRLISSGRVFREGGIRPYGSREQWEQELRTALGGSSTELVAVVAPPGTGSNRLYLFFRTDAGSGPLTAESPCFALTLAVVPATPVLTLDELANCGAITREVRSVASSPEAMMEFWGLAAELRDP